MTGLGQALIGVEFDVTDDIIIDEVRIDTRSISVPANVLRSLTDEEFAALGEQMIGGDDAGSGKDLHNKGDVGRSDRDPGFWCPDWHRLFRPRGCG